ncbi:MAG: RNHCP domain-containing protein [Patescibacteria group bacterium]
MFRKYVEDFKCENCGSEVRGDGYTNHCPRCLWSKHVDISPGDRASECGGLMEPVEYSYSVSEKWVVHRCVICGVEKKNRLSSNDSLDALLGD